MKLISKISLTGLLALVLCWQGCGDNDSPIEEPEQKPVVNPDNGDVSFVITNENGSGTGTTSSPAVVSKGETLNMVISQKSSFTDSDGTVFTCEPKATISLYADVDTVYAQNENLLTQIQEDSDVKTSENGTNPVRHLIDQTFKVGSQSINFDLAYEVYTYVTKANQEIEMPYIKVNQASFGSSEASEDDTQTRAAASISDAVVTLTPLAQTRAIVNDTVWYDVNVRFNLDVESQNTKNNAKQTIAFSVNYLGGVVSTMEVPDPERSSLSYTVDVARGSGEGTEASPAVSVDGDSLRINISQVSSYSDTDGSKIERNPNAVISLFASQDVVYATSLEKLSVLAGEPETKTSKSGSDPVCNLINQVFNVGGKAISVNSAYEVYTYKNKAEKNIELPYVEISPAGEPVISVTETPKTRAVVNDTVFYTVSAQFKLNITTKNVIDAEESSQTLVCVVSYPAAVVTSTEIPDEDNGTVSFEISASGGSGAGTTASPYVVSAGNTLNLTISQKSRYTDVDWSVFECEPKATISLYAEKDVVYGTSLDQLTSLAGEPVVQNSESGTNPVNHGLTQTFTIGGQPVHFDLGYEVYSYTTLANQTMEMPYIKVNQADYQGTQYAASASVASVTAKPQTRATVSDTVMYDVKVRFNLTLESMNTAETSDQTIAFEVTYPAGVITETEVEEPELVRVEYRTGYDWEEAHDNLPLLYYASVYRDRYYSNGEVITDRFVDSGHMVGIGIERNPEYAGVYDYVSVICIFDDLVYEQNDEQNFVVSCTLQVPDPTLISVVDGDERYGVTPGEWDKYVVEKLYETGEFIDAAAIPSSGSWESDSRQSGWYFSNCGFLRNFNLYYQNSTSRVCYYSLNIHPYDQFLVVDGRRIDFLEYQPEFHYNTTLSEIDNGLLCVNECRFEYLGRDFYLAAKTTIISNQ